MCELGPMLKKISLKQTPADNNFVVATWVKYDRYWLIIREQNFRLLYSKGFKKSFKKM